MGKALKKTSRLDPNPNYNFIKIFEYVLQINKLQAALTRWLHERKYNIKTVYNGINSK